MFLCALRAGGEPLSQAEVFGSLGCLRRSGASSLEVIVDGPFAAAAAANTSRTQLARWRRLVGAGDIRLDNADEVARLAGVARGAASDLELVLAALDRCGEKVIGQLLGDFSLIVWDAHAHKLLAVRDAFGVRPLFESRVDALVLFASGVAPLQRSNPIDPEYVAGFLRGDAGVRDHTIWQGIRSVPPGTFVRQRGTVRSTTAFWQPESFAAAQRNDVDVHEFRVLLETAVHTRLSTGEQVWAQLSGGLDSSAVTALAAVAAPGQLAGTVTLVDTLGDGDERAYSSAVVDMYRLRNEHVRNCWPWQDDGEPPPLTSQPVPMYPFFSRERQIGNLLRSSGARVLLTGHGADHYLAGSLDYITDLARSGRFGAALQEVTTWSVSTRQSFWNLGRRYLFDPFVPRVLQSRVQPLPAWLSARLAALPRDDEPQLPQLSRFAHNAVAGLRALPAWLDPHPFGSDIEQRHPFLYRPLVEWSLQLPPQHRIRPNAPKWILRESLRDVLPESVRTRATKGGIDARIVWALQHERARIEMLLRDPILAQLDCIEPARLRMAVDQARRGVPVHNVQLFSALSLETWLAVQAGRWDSERAVRAA